MPPFVGEENTPPEFQELVESLNADLRLSSEPVLYSPWSVYNGGF